MSVTDPGLFSRTSSKLFGGNDLGPCHQQKIDTQQHNDVHNIATMNNKGITNLTASEREVAINHLNCYNILNIGFKGGLQELTLTAN